MDDEEFKASALRDTDVPADEGDSTGSDLLRRGGSPPSRQTIRRIILLACTLILGLLALVAGIRSSLGLAVLPFPSSSPTPTHIAIPPIVAEQMTATADAEGWAALEQRPLHLPSIVPGSPCPLVPARQLPFATYGPALGDGPFYTTGFNNDGTLSTVDAAHFGEGGSAWGGAKVVWAVAQDFKGPAVVRGHQIDGPHEMRFNGGIDQQSYPGNWADTPLLPELQLTEKAAGGSYIRLQAPGCYAMQVDGLSFSYAIVFQAA